MPSRHRNFSRETRKREICWREISHGKIRREKREIIKSKIRDFLLYIPCKSNSSAIFFSHEKDIEFFYRYAAT